MADTRISKIKVRQGNFADLPILDSGEIGYATDDQRLFIGNTTIAVGTGNGVLTAFTVPSTLEVNAIRAVYVAGSEVAAADYSITGTTLTFSTPPANGSAITISFNSEIELVRHATRPDEIELAANGNTADTGFSVATADYNVVFMDYTLESTNGVRMGQLRFGTDVSASTSTIDDIFTEAGAVDVVFNVDIGTPGTMKLQYTDSDNAIAKFKYTYQLWNTN